MWRDPDEEEAKERKVKRRKIYDRVDAIEEEEEVEDEGRRRKGALGYETGLSEVVVDEEDESEDTKAAREEEEDWFSMDVSRDERASSTAYPFADSTYLILLQTATRLGLTLAYLRRTYSYVTTSPSVTRARFMLRGSDSFAFCYMSLCRYCFWCGCAYDNKKDLDANCPGEDEDEH